MAFKFEKLALLHEKSGEKSIDFARAIFGAGSKLGMEYFRDKDSISTKHLELLCEHYNVPMTYFFDDSKIGDASAMSVSAKLDLLIKKVDGLVDIARSKE